MCVRSSAFTGSKSCRTYCSINESQAAVQPFDVGQVELNTVPCAFLTRTRRHGGARRRETATLRGEHVAANAQHQAAPSSSPTRARTLLYDEYPRASRCSDV